MMPGTAAPMRKKVGKKRTTITIMHSRGGVGGAHVIALDVHVLDSFATFPLHPLDSRPHIFEVFPPFFERFKALILKTF